MNSSTPVWIEPDWPAPASVRAVSTCRDGGVSRGPWASLNLGDRCGDDPTAVAANRKRLIEAIGAPGEPFWLQQQHGIDVVRARARSGTPPKADAAFATTPGVVCVVQTADCSPVLLCNRAGTEVAAIHAGWRGLAAGVIPAALAQLASPAHELLAWIGPTIGPGAFEVGDDVRSAMSHLDPDGRGFASGDRLGKWQADLPELVATSLHGAGVTAVHHSRLCTATQPQRFFSYRRDRQSGRMASLIWCTS